MCLAIPGKIIEITDNDPLIRSARVDFGGIVKVVSLACTPDATIDQYVLVHVGLAISTIDEAEAKRVFQFLDEMDELQDLQHEGHPLPGGSARQVGSMASEANPSLNQDRIQ
jgi:hydrogenase expression/formation protein HypC